MFLIAIYIFLNIMFLNSIISLMLHVNIRNLTWSQLFSLIFFFPITITIALILLLSLISDYISDTKIYNKIKEKMNKKVFK